MGPILVIQRYIGAGLIVALALVTAWGLRVDHLRGGYKQALSTIVITLENVTGRKTDAKSAPVAIEAIGLLRDRYRVERNTARLQIDIQSKSIRDAGEETRRQTAIADSNRKLAAATIRQRDAWIKRARDAESRTERLSAEAELEECNEVLDALYRDGF